MLPTPVSIAIAVATAVGVLWWTGVRALGARKKLQEVRSERDAAFRTLEGVVAAVGEGVQRVRQAAQQAAHGVAHTNLPPRAARPRTGDVCRDAVHLLEDAFDESCRSVLAAAAQQHQMLNPQAELAELFNSIVPRLQSLINRAISVISEVERTIEDPDLLAGIWRVDHLQAQMRRVAESIAVLAGNTPSRDSAPVLLATVIRRAVAEIPEYARVRVAWSEHGAAALPGYVSPNVVHLLAALMENATAFSSGKVEVFTSQASGGIAIEVLDRGTGMSQQKREALNRLLAAPKNEDPRARLRAGTIGLLVAGLLAERHKITIELWPHIVGGTRAIVVIPPELLVSSEMHNAARPSTQGRRPSPPMPSGPTRREHTMPRPEDSAELPRRTRPAPPVEVAPNTSPTQDGSRPPLPRRSQTSKPVPRPAQQTPAANPTGGLMASFRSRKPPGDAPRPHPPSV
ncbi:ATP-binding protein [Streptomyces lydicus]|uniref:ATP-binding protein n=1 Tax=Streptomyces lydicus TaxID=47763 RepID=UPI00379B7D89